MKLKVTRYTSLVLLIAWMCVIFFFSSETADISNNTSDGVIVKVVSAVYPEYDTLDTAEKQKVIDRFSAPIRKSAHFLEFSLFGALAFIFFWTFSAFPPKYRVTVSLVVGLLYAVSDELHQVFVSGRACRVTDVFIDFSGVALAVIFAYLIALRFRGDKVEQQEL